MSSSLFPKKQRALILQGGGALGAYEAGVFEAIYKKISEEDPKWKGSLFDILAGASIGAINVTFLASYFLKNGKSWASSDTALATFWEGFKNNTLVDNENPFFRWWFDNYWNYLNKADPVIAPAEAARRYWSLTELANIPWLGARNLSYTIPQVDYRFLDPSPFNSTWLGYDYLPLRRFMAGSIGFPIRTSFENGEPRLLLVGVDVQDCTEAVTFDSYPKPDNSWYSHYGTGNSGKGYRVSYDGIGIDQLFASCLFPYALSHSQMEDQISKEPRTFWDGACLSNTPLREVLQHHRDFWLDYFDKKKIDFDKGGEEGKVRVPDLEVYIINLYPSTEKSVPANLDAIRDREIDIKFHDRTKYDEQVAHIVTDYITLAEKLMKLAKDRKIPEEEINKILDQQVGLRSENREGEKRRSYRGLLAGRFKVNVVRIDRQDDGNTIFGKHADFSATTIEDLMEKGRKEAGEILGQSPRLARAAAPEKA